MQRDLTPSPPQRNEGDGLGASNLAGMSSRGTSDETTAALTLGERVLLSVGIEALCLIVRAAELLAREGPRRGHERAVLRRVRRPGR